MISYSYVSLWYQGPLTASFSSMKALRSLCSVIHLPSYTIQTQELGTWREWGWQPPPAPPLTQHLWKTGSDWIFPGISWKKVSCPLSSSHPKMWLALPWVTIILLIFKADHSFLSSFSCPRRVCSVSAQLCELHCPWVFYSLLSLVSGHPQKSDS